MSTHRYTVSAGNNMTELGEVGHAQTLLGARRKGRAAVRSLPDAEGSYTVWSGGRRIYREERSIRTDWRWMEIGA